MEDGNLGREGKKERQTGEEVAFLATMLMITRYQEKD